MVKVLFQNNKNWASYKCHKTFLKFGIWNSRNDTSCAAMYLSFTYMQVCKYVSRSLDLKKCWDVPGKCRRN